MHHEELESDSTSTTTSGKFREMSPEDLAFALASDPELLAKAAKAIIDAKAKKAEIDKAKAAEKAKQAGSAVYDAKAWAKAKKLITGPYNDANLAELKAALASTDPSFTPEGEKSLLCVACEYLAARERVDLEWPMRLVESGAAISDPEVSAICSLFNTRSISGLGGSSFNFFVHLFSQPLEWARIETEIFLRSKNGDMKEGCAYYFTRHAMGIGGYSSSEHAAKTWNALELLVNSGCRKFEDKQQSSQFYWERLASSATKDPDTIEAKSQAMLAMVKSGWCDVGTTSATDNLKAASGPQNENCSSRAFLNHAYLDSGSILIFDAICERETERGFSRYDSCGRSRLYFINERLRNRYGSPVESSQAKVAMALAQRCLDLGDPPESVNAQNPFAKASTELMAGVLRAAIEKREISNISKPSAPTEAAKPRPRPGL